MRRVLRRTFARPFPQRHPLLVYSIRLILSFNVPFHALMHRRFLQRLSYAQSPQYAAPACDISVRRQVMPLMQFCFTLHPTLLVLYSCANWAASLTHLPALTRALGGSNGRLSLPTTKLLLVYHPPPPPPFSPYSDPPNPVHFLSLTLSTPSGFQTQLRALTLLSCSPGSPRSWRCRPSLGSVDAVPVWAVLLDH